MKLTDYGYMSILFNKQHYFPGQKVRGYVILDVFNPFASSELRIRLKGKEYPGKFSQNISKILEKNPETFTMRKAREGSFSMHKSQEDIGLGFKQVASSKNLEALAASKPPILLGGSQIRHRESFEE